jgi:hypothetical protein
MNVLVCLDADEDAVVEFCRRNGVRRLAAFGSALRDDFTRESDVDLLVEFLPGQHVSLFDMTRMEMGLEELIEGHRIDLRTSGDLGVRFRDEVVAEARRSMTSPRDDDRIAHMVEACEQTAEFVAGLTGEDLDGDRMLSPRGDRGAGGRAVSPMSHPRRSSCGRRDLSIRLI